MAFRACGHVLKCQHTVFWIDFVGEFFKTDKCRYCRIGVDEMKISEDHIRSIWNDDDGLTPSNSRLYAAFAYWMAHNSISIADAADFTFNNMLCFDLVITGLKWRLYAVCMNYFAKITKISNLMSKTGIKTVQRVVILPETE